MAIFNNYGLQVLNESYSSESSLLNSLLGELAKTELQPDIALISGAAESIVALQNAQNDFETSHLAYEQNKAQEGTYTYAFRSFTIQNQMKLTWYLHILYIWDVLFTKYQKI